MNQAEPRATFNAMENATLDDWKIIAVAHAPYQKALANRVLAHLRLLEGDHGGFPIDRFQHSLQTASRALRDGRGDDYVVCALLHDIGDTLASANHPDIAAAILKPYVSEDLHWMVENHGIFQGYYFFEHLGLDKDMREAFRGHPSFVMTAEFCQRYDQTAFDPVYDTLPLDAFEPMVQRVFSEIKRSIYLPPAL